MASQHDVPRPPRECGVSEMTDRTSQDGRRLALGHDGRQPDPRNVNLADGGAVANCCGGDEALYRGLRNSGSCESA